MIREKTPDEIAYNIFNAHLSYKEIGKYTKKLYEESYPKSFVERDLRKFTEAVNEIINRINNPVYDFHRNYSIFHYERLLLVRKTIKLIWEIKGKYKIDWFALYHHRVETESDLKTALFLLCNIHDIPNESYDELVRLVDLIEGPSRQALIDFPAEGECTKEVVRNLEYDAFPKDSDEYIYLKAKHEEKDKYIIEYKAYLEHLYENHILPLFFYEYKEDEVEEDEEDREEDREEELFEDSVSIDHKTIDESVGEVEEEVLNKEKEHYELILEQYKSKIKKISRLLKPYVDGATDNLLSHIISYKQGEIEFDEIVRRRLYFRAYLKQDAINKSKGKKYKIKKTELHTLLGSFQLDKIEGEKILREMKYNKKEDKNVQDKINILHNVPTNTDDGEYNKALKKVRELLYEIDPSCFSREIEFK